MRNSILYQPLALLLALLLLPDASWLTNSSRTGAGAFQAAADDIQICDTAGNLGTNINRIVNVCRYAGASLTDWIQFQNNAIADYLTAHDLPQDDASVIFTYGRTDLRSEIRALMFARLLNIIKTPAASRTGIEPSIYAGFQKTLQPIEIQYLSATINEWNRWRSNACTFTLDPDVASA